MQRMAAAASNPGQVIVFISNTGRTISIVECAKLAKQAGAKVIAITCKQSPLSDCADITIDCPTTENTDIFTPMTSRLVHLTVIDILTIGVTLKKGPQLQEHLRKIKQSLQSTRF